MPSHFDRRTIGSSDPSHHNIPSGHHNIGAPAQFTSVDASQHRGKGQQGQHQSFQPSVTPQGFMGYYGHDNIGGSIPPPPRRTYDNPSFRCTRCGHPFASQTELDHHSFVCGAAALLTEMFTPYSAQHNDQYQQPQPYLPAPHGAAVTTKPSAKIITNIAVPDRTDHSNCIGGAGDLKRGDAGFHTDAPESTVPPAWIV